MRTQKNSAARMGQDRPLLRGRSGRPFRVVPADPQVIRIFKFLQTLQRRGMNEHAARKAERRAFDLLFSYVLDLSPNLLGPR